MLSVACNSDQTTKARIFERRQIDSTEIMIKYQYTVDSRQYVDSATISNIILPQDTITVKVSSSNPAKSTPHLED